jgi:hypothetical protein
MSIPNPTDQDDLQARIHREMLDNADEELEMEFTTADWVAYALSSASPLSGKPLIAVSTLRSCCVSKANW